MFCPKCATQNIDGAKFCRSCGADISLVPHAMTGQIEATSPGGIDNVSDSAGCIKPGKEPSLERGMKNAFMGLGFLVVAFALFFTGGGRYWWYWMLIPGFMMIGGGVADYLRWRYSRSESAQKLRPMHNTVQTGRPVTQLPPFSTSELVAPPPSVTEGTTRHLGAEGPTKIFAPAERPK